MRAVALLAALPLAALAAGEAAPAATAAPPAPALPMLLALLAVVAAIFGLAWVVKRAGLRPTGAAPGLLQPVAAMPVGARERVVVVQVADQWLVLGVTGQSVNALAQIPAQPLAAAPAPASPFAAALARALGPHAKR